MASPSRRKQEYVIVSRETMSEVFAIVNQKGGVGKTTIAINLAACLGAKGYPTLLVDMDPQGNATSGVGIDRVPLERHIYQLLLGEASADEVIHETAYPGLFLLPSRLDLVGCEVDLMGMEGKEYRLREALQGIKDRFSFILVDAPPSLGILTLNVMAAAKWLLIPVQCEYYALEALGLLTETYRRVRERLNPELEIKAFILNMFDGRTKLSQQVQEEVRRYFGPRVLQTVLSRTVRLGEAPSYGAPIIYYDPRSVAAERFWAIAGEFLRIMGVEKGADDTQGTDNAKPTTDDRQFSGESREKEPEQTAATYNSKLTTDNGEPTTHTEEEQKKTVGPDSPQPTQQSEELHDESGTPTQQ